VHATCKASNAQAALSFQSRNCCRITLQHAATHSNTLEQSSPQHTATHCNTLQHAATHCTTGARGLIHIRHSPFALTIVAGQTSPAHSNTNGTCSQRAHAHQICSFSLWLRDAFSNTRDSGGDDVRAHLMGPFAVQDRAGHTATHCITLQLSATLIELILCGLLLSKIAQVTQQRTALHYAAKYCNAF